jgi:hypothetical protein
MEIRKAARWHAVGEGKYRRRIFYLRFFIFIALTEGCGAPGEPRPPQPPVPVAITDLAARQIGDGVSLTFTLPRDSVDGERLAEPPAIEIFRGTTTEGRPAKSSAARLVYVVPSTLVETYLTGNRVQFLDPIPAEEIRAHANDRFLFLVKTRASKKRASADSNVVLIRLYPVPEPIAVAKAVVTEAAIELSWSPPEKTTSGAPLAELAGYRIYRAVIDPASAAAASQDISKAVLKTPLDLLAPSPVTSFRDTQFEFGATYLYSIRSVATADSTTVESGDSAPVVVTPRDVFPPAAPLELVAVFVPLVADLPAHVELSWSISPETDLAGYRVYRNEQGEGRGELLTRELLLTPAFRDMSVSLGRRYVYRVTAVDRAGNESEPSIPAAVTLPEPNP